MIVGVTLILSSTSIHPRAIFIYNSVPIVLSRCLAWHMPAHVRVGKGIAWDCFPTYGLDLIPVAIGPLECMS